MVTSIILINVKRGSVAQTAQALLELDGIAEVYSVGGQWDLVALVRVKENDQLADLVTNHIATVDTIEKTTTLIAFRAYSKYDLEAMFSIGLEDQ